MSEVGGPASEPYADNGEERGSSARFRRLLIDLHLYSGLIASAYLIPMAISALQINHNQILSNETRSTETWTATVDVPDGLPDWDLSEAVIDDQQFVGWTLPWSIGRNDAGDLDFQVVSPGVDRDVRVSATGQITVEERRKNVWPTLLALHAGERVPGSLLSYAWWLFTLFAVVIVMFSTASGVYLWYVSGRDRGLGWAAVVIGTVVFVALALPLAV